MVAAILYIMMLLCTSVSYPVFIVLSVLAIIDSRPDYAVAYAALALVACVELEFTLRRIDRRRV